MNTVIRLFVMLAFLALLVPAAWAQVTLPHYDGFDYPDGANLGSRPGWVRLNSGDSLTIATGSLSYPGFPASSGNMLRFDGAGTDASKEFTLTTTGAIYYSYLLRVTALGGMGTDTAGYCSGFYQSPSSTVSGTMVWHRRNGTGFDIGVSTRLTSDKSFASGKSLNTTYLIVASYQFVDGATNDSSKLWIDPDASTFGKTEPAPTLTSVNSTTDMTGAARVFIRQDLANTSPFIELDELRIGTSYADVTRALSATSVKKDADATPREFRLDQNYPNPFNPTTNIRFSVDATNDVRLSVMDVLGRNVATLVNQTLTPGTYTVKWDASSLPSGVYFYTVRSGGMLSTKRMILAK